MASSFGEGNKDLRDVFNLLESKERHTTDEIKSLIQENLSSNKESWLITNLVDYYYVSRSERVVEILTEVRSSNVKHLLEKLQDGLKSQETHLSALQLLLYVVCKQPIWLPSLAQSPIFKAVLKCLKTEKDIPVLTTAVTVVTILLPSIPTTVGSYLPEIFEIFNRLASFSVKKPAGNIPDVFLLHLQVSVYSLFHRLYGMFPYNFLAYLRQYYSHKENLPVFEQVVKSMLERVRLHPLLITGSKDQETSTGRWRQMETQDVVVECARMSLDLVEGTWEELHCPVIASRYIDLQSHFGSHNRNTASASAAPHARLPPIPRLDSTSDGPADVGTIFWSPSEIIGLSTPPSSQRTTPATSLTEAHLHPNMGALSFTPHLTPPVNTPRETPPISEDIDREKSLSRNTSRSTLTSRSNADPKRLSTEFPGNIAPSFPFLTPISQAPSVPPSPLKAEFTSTPPLGLVKTQPVLQAARELQFDGVEIADDLDRSPDAPQLRPVPSGVKKYSSDVARQTATSSSKNQEPLMVKEAVDTGQKVVSQITDTEKQSNDKKMADTDGEDSELSHTVRETVSVSNLSHVIEELEVTEGTEADADDEVSELTSSERSANSSAMLTAESVAKFMRSVNRIRFNSLTASNNLEQFQTKYCSKTRSRSCPQLPKLAPSKEEEETEELSRSVSSTLHNTSQQDDMTLTFEGQKDEVKGLKSLQDLQGQDDVSISSNSSTVTINKKSENISAGSGTAGIPGVNVGKCPMFASSVNQESTVPQENSALVTVLRQLLNPLSSSTVCQKCQSKSSSTNQSVEDEAITGNSGPLFKSFSPPELLDRHLKLGGEIHAKELNNIPITSQHSVNWTHFGGMPPADEINILRGQLTLLHTQLMFERHKREQHAKRNRRLLRKITHAKTVEEQNAAMESQVRQHEETICNLQVSMKLLQEENRKMKNIQDSDDNERMARLRVCLKENEDLKAAKKEFNTLLVRQREEQDSLRKKLMGAEAKLFNAEKELGFLREHAVVNQKLKEQVLQLHKELLLQGELQQKCQEKLQSIRNTSSAHQKAQFTISTLKAEKKALKDELDRKTWQLESSQSRILEREESLRTRDISLSDLKQRMEDIKSSHEDEIQAVEEKYLALSRINQQLEAQVLQLFSEIEDLKMKKSHPIPARPAPSDTGTPPDGSGPGRPGDEEQTEPRDRTSSDPGKKPSVKEPVTRMGSAPTSAVDNQADDSYNHSLLINEQTELPGKMDLRDTDSLVNRTRELEITDSFDEYVEISQCSEGKDSDTRLFDKQFHVHDKSDRSETSSLSSRNSSLYPGGRRSLLYTDSDDNRSASIRSHTLSDSGYSG